MGVKKTEVFRRASEGLQGSSLLYWGAGVPNLVEVFLPKGRFFGGVCHPSLVLGLSKNRDVRVYLREVLCAGFTDKGWPVGKNKVEVYRMMSTYRHQAL